MVPMVPTKIASNIRKLLTVYPAGLHSEQIPHLYKPQDHIIGLYPPEVVGPKGTLTHEKIPPEATPGGIIEVLVAEIITPLNFWVQLRGENTHLALDKLMNEMQLFYQQEAGNYNMPDATVRIGQYCVAPYNEEWHRACITAVHNLVDVQVIFVDYGTKCRIKKSELRFMHTDYAQFPIQAIRASLANLVPVGGGLKWPHEAGVQFLHLVEDKDLVAILSSVDHEARKLEVALVDTTGDEDIHINDVLVNKGFAEYKTKRQASPFPLQPKRIDGDPVSSAVTVNRPSPCFTAVSELHKQPLNSPTGSAAPGESKYVPEMPDISHPKTSLPSIPIVSNSTYVPGTQGQTHLLISLPTLPMDHTIQSNFVPQPTNMLVPPVMYDAPLLANASSLEAQSSMLQQLMFYENILHQQQLRRYCSLLLPHNIGAATLVNPFMVPELSPRMVYIPTPGSDRVTAVGQSELCPSEVSSCSLPLHKNAVGKILPSGTGQLAATADVSAGESASAYAALDIHTETKEPPSVMSPGVSHLSGIFNSSSELCAADVLCDEQLTAEAIISPMKVKAVRQITNEQQKNKNELVLKALSNTALRGFSSGCYQSDDMLVADSHGLESKSPAFFEHQYVNDGREPATDVSTSSDDIYRNDDEYEEEEEQKVYEEQMQSTLRKSGYVKQIEIAGRVIHLIKVMSNIYLCTEEVVKYFTDFSGRHVVLKILDSRGVKPPFCEIGRKESRAIIEDLESYDVVGVPKTPDGSIIAKVHLTPLTSVTHLIPFLIKEHQQEFCSVMESVTW